jgi:hypothetical protein
VLEGAREHVGKQGQASSKAPAKGKKAASPKKQPSKSAKQAASAAKETVSDLEVGLSDAEEQKQQMSSSLEDAGRVGVPLTYSRTDAKQPMLLRQSLLEAVVSNTAGFCEISFSLH